MIICIANNKDFVKTLEKYFSAQGEVFQAHKPPFEENLDIKREDVLILQEPIVINNNYLSVSLCWKRYLKLHSPKIVLIIAGIGEISDVNYLDLLQLPKDIQAFIENARQVEEEWIPKTTGGIDVARKLNRFFEGHGDESFTDELYKMLRICKIAKDELTIHKTDFESVKNELLLANKLPHKWNVLQSRWQFYMPYFKGLPFFKHFQALDEILQALAPFFAGDCKREDLFWKTDCVERLETLKSGLEKIEANYAR